MQDLPQVHFHLHLNLIGSWKQGKLLVPIKADLTVGSIGFQNSWKLWLDRRKWLVSGVCSFAFNELLASEIYKARRPSRLFPTPTSH